MLKLGRKARLFNPGVPHLSSLIINRHLPPPPTSVNYLTGLPKDCGMMLNDQLGDCTIAAVYHAIQVWTLACAGLPQTNPDADVLKIYEAFCGYVNGDPSTDQGGIEQTVLADWLNQGVPTNTGVNKLRAWIEVDVRNVTDIMRVIDSCGVCYIGFNVPQNILPQDGSPPPLLWQVDRKAPIIGGHAVVLGKYDPLNAGLISWGSPNYQMTWDFFTTYTEEAYALVDLDWVNATGKTPLGLTLDQLVQQMQQLRH